VPVRAWGESGSNSLVTANPWLRAHGTHATLS
jgi:hypothetical protein